MSRELTTKPVHGTPIVIVGGKPSLIERVFQTFFDQIEQRLNDHFLGNQIELEVYTVATLPVVPALPIMGIIGVSDMNGGAEPAYSDGTNWRKMSDKTVAS